VAGVDAEALAGEGVLRVDAALAQRRHRRVGEDPRAVRGGGPGDGHDEPRVVLELAVPGQQRAAQPVLGERRREPAGLVRADPARRRQRVAPRARGGAHDVAELDADADLRRRPAADARRPWDEVGERPHEVRGDDAHEQRALGRGLPGHAPLALLEVAQAAVHELRAPAARAVREVAALEQRDREPAARGVERHAGAGDPAADDHEVDRLAAGEGGELARPALRVQRRGAHGRRYPSIARSISVHGSRPGSSSPRDASTNPRAISSIAAGCASSRIEPSFTASSSASASRIIRCMPPTRRVM
jgi:hypothetical protein